ncbi:nuclease-related domain-containing protein [Methylomicrobium sp. Wu6]|uniref:nuclease-related domain-containing protein n=1 Tax=Methylomicrobium sp. Wu6 TaxID=3107928 RepID=UPI002DD6596C|nr:nuclease-related domain-containing protein [Methylomicrobium sp. Wu6]MEC4749815.1 nuclease-related domain-containing protein [Methylomicrobium sp. Wu6]
MLVIFCLVNLSFLIGYKIGNYTKEKSEFYIQNDAESNVKEVLKYLDKNKYYVMHDITLPTEEGTTQIDHIVFSQTGIFVIETKGHKGWIFGNEKDKNWTQALPRGKKFKFYNPVIQNNNHIKNIVKISNIPIWATRTIIVFTNQETEFKTKMPNHVIKINELTSFINKWNLNTLDKKQLHEAIGCIEFYRKERSEETNRRHIEYINKKFN